MVAKPKVSRQRRAAAGRLPAAVSPGAERDRAGIPAGQVSGDRPAEPHHSGRSPTRGRRGLRRLPPEAASETSKRTMSGHLANRVSTPPRERGGFLGHARRCHVPSHKPAPGLPTLASWGSASGCLTTALSQACGRPRVLSRACPSDDRDSSDPTILPEAERHLDRCFFFTTDGGRRFPRRVNATVPSPDVYG